MSYVELPVPEIKVRNYNNELHTMALASGLDPMLAQILAGRAVDPQYLEQIISPKLANLKHPANMQDLQKAAKRLALAIINKECIGIETDHDCDGQTSHAVIYHNLVHHFKHPKNLIRSYIGHRLTEGYGLSAAVAARILADQPKVSVLITADNGSSDEPRIATLKAAGITVIVTDHHQIPLAGFPYSAYAFINPTRQDCGYDPYIAGCMVAWLLMVATRAELISLGYLSNNVPKLLDTLDYVAVGTVADCVSFAKSPNNRAIVSFGLQLINANKKFCWQALRSILPGTIEAEDLGFKIGPLLNSDGRLANAFGSVSFLLAESLIDANNWLEHLTAQNKLRREIQKTITITVIRKAKQQYAEKRLTICVYLTDGHAGVHGISASKIKDYFGRPTAIFSPRMQETDLITGSIRGIDLFHVRHALQAIVEQAPGLLVTFGGHKGAGGVTLRVKDFSRFYELFEWAALQQLGNIDLKPIIWSDGLLAGQFINLDLLTRLKMLAPYGREFESPIFHNVGIIKNLKLIGDGTHAKIDLELEGKIFRGVWFSMKQMAMAPCLFEINDRVKVAFSLLENNFNNRKNCELQIIGMQKY